ncbi:hypothetical protein [Pelagibius sp. Alg239-R121]|uniref:hypothetical protein n=1 Tax=Pelagibius sp. Alg239-R121 TaxID=2993448 RepID=UPI0024A63389|nr:hypothetical protein [Pelagibius sp. Alg239-R121]
MEDLAQPVFATKLNRDLGERCNDRPLVVVSDHPTDRAAKARVLLQRDHVSAVASANWTRCGRWDGG